MDIAALKLVQKYTERGLSDCRRALEISDGDPLLAISSLIDKSTLDRLRGHIGARTIVPNNLSGPPSPEEKRILDFIISEAKSNKRL